MSEKTITIFGTGRAKSGDAAYELAFELGKRLAEAGFTIANGGYGGTMLAAAKGADEVGGKSIGHRRHRSEGYGSVVTAAHHQRREPASNSGLRGRCILKVSLLLF